MVNKSYLEKETLAQIKEYFSSSGFVTLQQFLDKKEIKKISVKKYKFEDEPLTHRYSSGKIPKIFDLDFISKVIGKKISKIDAKIIKLTQGNYELRGNPKPGFEIVFCLNSWHESFGGQVIYADDNTGDFFALPTTKNTFSIVKRGKSTSRFIKYVNNHAKKENLILVIGKIK